MTREWNRHYLYLAVNKNGINLALTRDVIIAENIAQAYYIVIVDEFTPEVYGGYSLYKKVR